MALRAGRVFRFSWTSDLRICSVVPAAVLAAISTESHPENFEPSVPFVACLAAAFVVGELVKMATVVLSVLEPRFQMDALQGPERGEFYAEDRGPTCECVTRAKNIDRQRGRRADVKRREPAETPLR